MNKKYEFEETKSDKKKAGMTIASLITLGVGAVIKTFEDVEKNKKRVEYDEIIDRKKDQYRSLDTRLFQTPKVKNYKSRLMRDINDLEEKKNKL